MKKIILSLIIVIAIVAGYVGYQRYNNQQNSQVHEQMNNVQIQGSSNGDDDPDGASCTEGSDCNSGNCFDSTCTACVVSGGFCSEDSQCCAGECNTVESLCDVTDTEAGLEYFALSVGAVLAPAIDQLENGTSKEGYSWMDKHNKGLKQFGPENNEIAWNPNQPASQMHGKSDNNLLVNRVDPAETAAKIEELTESAAVAGAV